MQRHSLFSRKYTLLHQRTAIQICMSNSCKPVYYNTLARSRPPTGGRFFNSRVLNKESSGTENYRACKLAGALCGRRNLYERGELITPAHQAKPTRTLTHWNEK
jgi:hypothetical protein